MLVLAGMVAGPGSKGFAASRPLRVCLVSGANDSKPYATDATFQSLADTLRTEHGMVCEVLVLNATGSGFERMERLLEADVAIFHVRRKTLDAHHLALLRTFFASGKGFIALRSTSHGFENWPEFDVEVLGARYGPGVRRNVGNAERLIFKPHPIWEGVVGAPGTEPTLSTRRDLYGYSDLAPDLDVILEGETRQGRVPVAWTRTRTNGGRLVHVALGYADEVATPGYRRMIVNALKWVTAPK